MIDALFFSRIRFSFFEATAVYCASDAATMVAYVGCCVGSGTGGGGFKEKSECNQTVQITNHPPRATHSRENRPTRPTDRWAP